MNSSGKKLSTKELILLGLLLLLVLYLAYNTLFDAPTQKQIEDERNAQAELNTQLTQLNSQIQEMQARADEIARIKDANLDIRMPSYNAQSDEVDFLNNAIPYDDFETNYGELSRSGDQVRRPLTVSFSTPTYEEMEQCVERICNSSIRCLIDEITCRLGKTRDGWDGPEIIAYSVSIKCTFYETMFDGHDDGRLPADKSAAN